MRCLWWAGILLHAVSTFHSLHFILRSPSPVMMQFVLRVVFVENWVRACHLKLPPRTELITLNYRCEVLRKKRKEYCLECCYSPHLFCEYSLYWSLRNCPTVSFIYLYSRKRSRAYTEVHVLQESPLKELQAGKLSWPFSVLSGFLSEVSWWLVTMMIRHDVRQASVSTICSNVGLKLVVWTNFGCHPAH